jgi:hypothetical protein
MIATGGTITTATDIMIAAVTGEDPRDRRRCTSYAASPVAGRWAVLDGRSGDLLVVPDARHSIEALEASAVLLTVAKLPWWRHASGPAA